MTSPARGGPDTAGMRACACGNVHDDDSPRGQIIAVLHQQADEDFDWSDAEQFADALLPVVQLLVVEKAAEELRAAADMEVEQRGRVRDAWEYDHGIADYRRALRDRADALVAAAQPTDGRTGE